MRNHCSRQRLQVLVASEAQTLSSPRSTNASAEEEGASEEMSERERERGGTITRARATPHCLATGEREGGGELLGGSHGGSGVGHAYSPVPRVIRLVRRWDGACGHGGAGRETGGEREGEGGVFRGAQDREERENQSGRATARERGAPT